MKKFLLFFLIITHFLGAQTASTTFTTINQINTLKKDTLWIRTMIQFGEQNEVLRHSFWDSIIPISQKYGRSDLLAKIYFFKAYITGFENGDVKKFKADVNQSIKYAQANHDSIFLASCYYDFGDLQEKMLLTEDAFQNYKLALTIYTQLNIKESMAVCNNRLGLLYINQGNIFEAINHLNVGLRLNTEIQNFKNASLDLICLGSIYKDQGDKVTALSYFKKAFSINQKIGEKYGMASALNFIGITYLDLNKLVDANYSLTKSLNLYKEIKDKSGISVVLNNLGLLLETENKFPEALNNYQKSIVVAHEIYSKEGIAYLQYHIGKIYFLTNKYTLAKVYLDSALKLSQEIGYPKNIYLSAFTLSQVDSATNNYSSAYKNYKLYILFKDSINNESTRKASVKNIIQREYEIKAAADSVKVAEEKKVTTLKLKQEETKKYFLIVGFILVLIFGIIMFNRFKLTKNQKIEIENQKKIVENQKHLVEEKQKDILDSINYAKRIQKALLPSNNFLKKHLKK